MPAMIWYDGNERYYKNNRLHRDDGPANMWITNNYLIVEWYHNGTKYIPKCIKL